MSYGPGIPTTALPGGGNPSAYGTGFPTVSQPGAGSSYDFPISFGGGAPDATLTVSMDGSQPTVTFANGETTTLPELANTLSTATMEGQEGDAARQQLLDWGFSPELVDSLLPPDMSAGSAGSFEQLGGTVAGPAGGAVGGVVDDVVSSIF